MHKRFSIGILGLALAFAISGSATASGIKFSYNKVSNTHPCQNASITYNAKIVNSSGYAVSGASVSLKVRYKTTTTSYSAGKSATNGTVSKSFRIGRATPNYKVTISSKAAKGSLSTTGSTSFTPKKCS